MITLRKAADRGQTAFDWLDGKHSFSFGRYYDEQHVGFGPLRVINEDIVQPAKGFGTHGHKNMEILTYVLDGALEHKDSMGNGAVIKPGEVQYMSAGYGVEHSEFNASQSDLVHLLQIWILPDRANMAPRYDQKDFSAVRKPGQLTLLASNDGREGSLAIRQDAEMAVLDLTKGQTFKYALPEKMQGWVQVARGGVTLNGETLAQGDGASTELGDTLEFTGTEDAEILVFTLPKY